MPRHNTEVEREKKEEEERKRNSKKRKTKGEKIREELTRADSKNCMRLDRKSLILDNVHTRCSHTHIQTSNRKTNTDRDRQTDRQMYSVCLYLYPHLSIRRSI